MTWTPAPPWRHPREGVGATCTASPIRVTSCGCRAACCRGWPCAGSLITLVGLVWGLFFAPADWQQGDAVRIMYRARPRRLAGLCRLPRAGGLLGRCRWSGAIRWPISRRVEIGPVGAGFTALCLVTGSLWGKPMWGAWWVWDARLTSVLVLFFLYLGHIALVRAFDDPQRGYRAGAILALVGVVNLPIIKFSVDWWNTLHQPATHHADRRADHVCRHAVAADPRATLGMLLGFVGDRAGAHPRRRDGAAHPWPAAGARAQEAAA